MSDAAGAESEYRRAFGAAAPPRLSGYLIVGRIGDGGQCRVWRAIRERDGLDVALKELRPPTSEAARERLLRAATALGRLGTVPWIERLVTVDHAQDGSLCVVVRYFEGEDLSKRFRSGAERHPAELLLAFVRLATALTGVHGHRLVHRDVTPRNVLVSSDHEVALIDFGLALDPQATRLTAPAMRLGTAGFTPPEQLSIPPQVDHRSDIWQLGALLEWCRAGTRVERQIRDPLDAIVTECRRGHMDERPQDLTQIVSDLRQILAGLISQVEGGGANEDERLLADVCRLELSPSDGSVRDRLAGLWSDRARGAKSPAEAVSALRRTVELCPADLTLRQRLAAAYLELARARVREGV